MHGRTKPTALPVEPLDTGPCGTGSSEPSRGLDRDSARIGRCGARSPAPEDVRLRAFELSEARGHGGVTLDDRLDAECELLVWESTVTFS